MMGLLSVHFHNNVRGYLICSNREESLRYDLEDFWAPITYKMEHLTNLPGYHPYNILIYIVCESIKNFIGKQNLQFYLLVSAHFVLVPFSYLKIVLFLRIQNKKIGGKATFIKLKSLFYRLCNSALTSNTLNGRRRQKNIVSIAFNLLAWFVDALGDMMGLLLMTYDFHLAMNLSIICSSGLTPVIYLIGGQEYFNRASSSGEKNFIQHLVSVFRGVKGDKIDLSCQKKK